MTNNKADAGDLAEKIEKRFKNAYFSLIPPGNGGKIVVAFSGGSDSTALLVLLSRIQENHGLRLFAAHLDHGLRGQSGQNDLLAAKKTAQGMGVEFISDKADCKKIAKDNRLSIETAARQARYDFLNRVKKDTGSDYIATGHTANDSAEVLLFNLMRGSGSAGLAGVPPVRGGYIIRPLLSFYRDELQEYLEIKGHSWVEDETNREYDFPRNKIRGDLIPKLARDYNPSILSSLARTASIFRDEESFWEDFMAEVKQRVGWDEELGTVRLSIKDMTGLHNAVKRRLVRSAVEHVQGHMQRLKLAHVDAILELAEKGNEKSLDLPGDFQVRISNGLLHFGSQNDRKPALRYEYSFNIPGEIFIQETGLKIKADVVTGIKNLDIDNLDNGQAVLDMERLKPPYSIRSPRPGDKYQPLGLKGKKKLKKIFSEAKIPKDKRWQTPILTDRAGILWVFGHRISERGRIFGQSQRFVLLTVNES